MSILSEVKVNNDSPNFNARKWNATVEHSERFDEMLTSILGENFKGIYNPAYHYTVGNYVWHDGKCYRIDAVKGGSNFIAEIPEGASNAVPGEDCVYYLGDDKKIYKAYGTKYQFKKKISDKQFDFFDTMENDCFAAFSGGKLFRVEDGVSKEFNMTFGKKQIDAVATDEYCVCAKTGDLEARIASCRPEDITVFKKVNSLSSSRIVDIAVNGEALYILRFNGSLEQVDKASGQVIASTDLSKHIRNAEFAKVTSIDKYTLFMYDGDSRIISFHKYNSDSSFVYCSEIESECGARVTSLNSAFGKIAASTELGSSLYLGSRYSYTEANVRDLLTTPSIIKVENAAIALDFRKGQLTSICGGRLKPEGYVSLSTIASGGIYANGELNIKLTEGKGAELYVGRRVKYALSNFSNKTIVIEGSTNGAVPAGYNIGTLCDANGKYVKLTIFKDGRNSAVKFKTFITIKGSYELHYTTFINGSIVESYTTSHSAGGITTGFLTLNSNYDTLLETLVVFNEAYPHEKIESLSRCGFDIPSATEDGNIPYSIIRNDADGNIPLKIKNKTILKERDGYRINATSNLSVNDPNILLTAEAGFKINESISSINETLKSVSKEGHSHDFSEINKVPAGNINGTKGIVHLSNSISESSDCAATPKAVKTAYDKANHGHPYFSDSGGTLNGNIRVAGGQIEVAKVNEHSWIRFDAQSSDSGYIMHYENNNAAIMRFVVSDDIGTTDVFQWGSDSNGGYNNCMQLTTSGNLWVKNSIDAASMHLSGNINANDLFLRSDKRVKKDIKKLENALECIMNISGYKYKLKADDSDSAGVIAQELRKVLPEAVKESVEDGILSVQYHGVTALLIEAVKELKEEIDKIKKWGL